MRIEHEFEDLGLTLDGGWSIGSNIDGMCIVEFNADGEWWIEDIFVNLRKGNSHHDSYLLDRTKPKERRRYHDIRELIMELDSDVIAEKVSEALPIDPIDFVHANSAGRTL